MSSSRTTHTSGRIIVVGGGLAGAAAALALGRAGRRVTLVEAKSRLGGRAGSYVDQASGEAIDYCQHVGMQCCASLRQVIQWLGQEDDWRVENTLHFYGPEHQYRCLKALPVLPAPLHLASWLWNWPGLAWSDRLRIGYGMAKLDRLKIAGPAAESLDDMSAIEWLQRHGQSQRALDNFWATVLVSALGEELSRVSLLAVAKVFQDGFLRSRDAFHLLIPNKPLKELFGTQVERALRELDVDVRLGQPVKELTWAERSASGASGTTTSESNKSTVALGSDACTGVVLASGEKLDADQVILSVPWNAVSGLLSDSPLAWTRAVSESAQQLGSSPISGVHTWWDSAWLPTPHAVLVGRLCQWVFPPSGSGSGRSTGVGAGFGVGVGGSFGDYCGEHYYQVVISASRQLPRGNSAELGELIREDLQKVFPGLREVRLLRTKVVTDPAAVFSVQPGSSSLRPLSQPGPGNLWLAGDWTKTGWPATMEGAILSGLRAASQVDARITKNGC